MRFGSYIFTYIFCFPFIFSYICFYHLLLFFFFLLYRCLNCLQKLYSMDERNFSLGLLIGHTLFIYSLRGERVYMIIHLYIISIHYRLSLLLPPRPSFFFSIPSPCDWFGWMNEWVNECVTSVVYVLQKCLTPIDTIFCDGIIYIFIHFITSIGLLIYLLTSWFLWPLPQRLVKWGFNLRLKEVVYFCIWVYECVCLNIFLRFLLYLHYTFTD